MQAVAAPLVPAPLAVANLMATPLHPDGQTTTLEWTALSGLKQPHPACSAPERPRNDLTEPNPPQPVHCAHQTNHPP